MSILLVFARIYANLILITTNLFNNPLHFCKFYKIKNEPVRIFYTNVLLTIFLFCLNLKNLFGTYRNSKHKNIKFTFETEDSNNFSFLDIKRTTKTKGLLLWFFTKPHLVELTNYNSFIFDTYKIGLVYTLLFRFFKICASMENFHLEVEHLRSISKCNNYPDNIIDQCIKIFLDKLYVPKQFVPTVPQRDLLVALPFLGTFYLSLRKYLYESISKSSPKYNIKVIFQSKNWMSSLLKFKDSIPLYLRSHHIYNFQCTNCNITYFGETERHPKVRAIEYISMSLLTRKRVNKNKKIFC